MLPSMQSALSKVILKKKKQWGLKTIPQYLKNGFEMETP